MNKFLVALEAKYVAQVQESLAVLELYVNKSVGVGDHPDVLTALDNAVSQLESAQSKLQTLRGLLTPQEEGSVDGVVGNTEVPTPA